MKVPDTDIIVSYHGCSRLFAYNAEHDCAFLREILWSPDRVMDGAVPEHVFKNDSTTTVVRVKSDHLDLVVKRYNTRNRWHVVKRAARRTRAMRSWDMAYELSRIGIDTPRPVAMIEERLGPVRKRSYYINEFEPGEPCLGYLQAHPAMLESVKDRLVQLFETLYRNRISHGDMKATNILVRDDGLLLLDLDAARRHVSRLAFNHAFQRDRSRFLRNWEEYPELSQHLEASLKRISASRRLVD